MCEQVEHSSLAELAQAEMAGAEETSLNKRSVLTHLVQLSGTIKAVD